MVYDGNGAYFVTEGMEDMMNGVRTATGQFAPGVSGNPAGRPRGARNAAMRGMEAMLQDKHEALTKAAIDKALAGDVGALRLCLNRLAPVGRDAPVPFDMPPVRNACEVMEASAALMKAMGDGEVTPDEAERVMALLKEHKGMIGSGLPVPYVGNVCFENFRQRYPSGCRDCDEPWDDDEEEDAGVEAEAGPEAPMEWPEVLGRMVSGDG